MELIPKDLLLITTEGGVARAPQKKNPPPKKKTRGSPQHQITNIMPALANDTFDLPLAKRQKTVIDQAPRALSRGGSKIFAPFRVRFRAGSL